MNFLFTFISNLIGIVMLSGCDSKFIWGHSDIADRFPGIPDEMFYQTKGTCEKGDLRFQVLAGAGALLWDASHTQSENDILTGQVFIYLHRNNTFVVNYREYDFVNLVAMKEFSSTYSFDPETQMITLHDLGIATIHKRKNNFFYDLNSHQM